MLVDPAYDAWRAQPKIQSVFDALVNYARRRPCLFNLSANLRTARQVSSGMKHAYPVFTHSR